MPSFSVQVQQKQFLAGQTNGNGRLVREHRNAACASNLGIMENEVFYVCNIYQSVTKMS